MSLREITGENLKKMSYVAEVSTLLTLKKKAKISDFFKKSGI
jgi:hypothetical protein